MSVLANAFSTLNLHVAGLPYRFSSWALDYPGNIALRVDAGDTLLGGAILQTPFWTIDAAVHPQAAGFAAQTHVGGCLVQGAAAPARGPAGEVSGQVEDVVVLRKEYGGSASQ